jgi:hypothetical protein
MGQQGGLQLDVVEARGILVSSRSSHSNRVKKQALGRDEGGNRYVVTPTCLTVSIDVGIYPECQNLLTNTSSIPCTVKHDLEERLQPIGCFLFVPVVLCVGLSIGDKEGMMSS